MKKFHLFLTLVALSLATTSLLATPSGAVSGRLPGVFQLGASPTTCKLIYISQGNLQYQASTNTWRFAGEQFEYIGDANSNISSSYSGWIDLFGWATSGFHDSSDSYNTQYHPYDNGKTKVATSQNYYGYGPSQSKTSGNPMQNLSYNATLNKYDWGVYNKISNGGNTAGQWRTLTSSEWDYLLFSQNRPGSTVNGTSGVRYVKANVNNINGIILFPENGTFASSDFTSFNSSSLNSKTAAFGNITCDLSKWRNLEARGCVFLPAAGRRDATSVSSVGQTCYYWTSSRPKDNAWQASEITASSSNFYVGAYSNDLMYHYYGLSVRLVQDVPSSTSSASIAVNPKAKSNLTYDGNPHDLVDAGIASGGHMQYQKRYKKITDASYGAYGDYSPSIPQGTNAGNYTVRCYAEGAACLGNSATKTVNITIAKAPFTPSVTITATANNFTYDGSAHDLLSSVDIEGDLGGGTLKYSIDGTNWSTTIPTATNVGNYTVHYKVVPADPTNYEDYIPAESPVEVTVAKAPYTPSGTYSVTANDLTYDGSDQPLVSLTGSVTDGTVWYKLEPSGDWTTEIPTEMNAGNYSVSYKVVPTDSNYDEYIPTPTNTIDVTISPANIVMPTINTTLIYNGAPQPLLDITGIVGGTIYYSEDGNEPWLPVCPSQAEIGTYDIWYKVDAANTNYNSIPATKVTVTIDDPYPFVADNEDPATKLTNFYNDGNPMSLKVKRTIYANDEYNTICLPFSLDASALAASPLAGFNRLKTLRGAKVTGIAPDLSIDILVEDATTIEAGIPYLISYPAGDNIVDPVFHDVTVTTTTPSATSADGVTFQGMFAQVHIDPYASERDEDYLFLGANSQLMWPASSQTDSSIKMRGFRAYFIINRSVITPALAPKGTRARIVDAPKTATGIDDASAKFGESEKILENGILYIIRNGVRYNAQGQIVK